MLSIQNLRAGYSGKSIVDVAHLELKTGEHCLILGQSGTGKTTLLYALAGLLTPISGQIQLNGTDLNQPSKSSADEFRGKNIGIVYQTLHMAGALSVLDNLLLARYAARLPPDRLKAEKLLSQLGLWECRDRKPSTLSQGQQQRVAIARAAMNDPKLILGDEPTSALDDEACDAVMRLLFETAKSTGASLIVATHDSRIKKHFQHIVRLENVQ